MTHLDFYKREVFIPLCNYSGKVASYVKKENMKGKKENEQAFLTLIKEYGRLIYKVCYQSQKRGAFERFASGGFDTSVARIPKF